METGNTLKLEVGDEVWDTRYGVGKLVEFMESKSLCYYVRFEELVWTVNGWRQYISYDREGKDNTEKRVLFKGNFQTYFSPRGHQLVFIGKPAEVPIVTIENYHKWYSIYLIMPDGSVQPFDLGIEVEFIDHTPFPGTLYDFAKKLGYYMDEQSYEMMVGRILDEHPEYAIEEYQDTLFMSDSNNLYSMRD